MGQDQIIKCQYNSDCLFLCFFAYMFKMKNNRRYIFHNNIQRVDAKTQYIIFLHFYVMLQKIYCNNYKLNIGN